MSWMITDKSKLKGTCYLEILPGRYSGQFWNPESVFFKEPQFSFIECFLYKRCPKYDHYAFTDINQDLWVEILGDLQRLYDIIQPSAQGNVSQENLGLMISPDNLKYLNAKPERFIALSTMLNDFTMWVTETLRNHDSIAVLGL